MASLGKSLLTSVPLFIIRDKTKFLKFLEKKMSKRKQSELNEPVSVHKPPIKKTKNSDRKYKNSNLDIIKNLETDPKVRSKFKTQKEFDEFILICENCLCLGCLKFHEVLSLKACVSCDEMFCSGCMFSCTGCYSVECLKCFKVRPICCGKHIFNCGKKCTCSECKS